MAKWHLTGDLRALPTYRSSCHDNRTILIFVFADPAPPPPYREKLPVEPL
jgi:hypothetical protein